MENHRIIEILELTIKQIPIQRFGFLQLGICREFYFLWKNNKITEDEYQFIYHFINENRPTPTNIFKEFLDNEYWRGLKDGFWWMPINEAPETRQIRIDYLKALIKSYQII